MKNLIKLFQLFLLIFLTACQSSSNKGSLIKETEDIQSNEINIEKEKMEIKVSCGKGGISQFLNDGWIIVEQYSQERICTWKSFPANKDCDMEKDKGCKITTPDKIGEEKVYLLERTKSNEE